VSARISDKVHEEIIDRCNKEGCTVNNFLNCAIELVLVGHTEFNFGETEEETTISESE